MCLAACQSSAINWPWTKTFLAHNYANTEVRSVIRGY